MVKLSLRVAFILLLSSAAFSQSVTIQVDHPYRSKSLAGIVLAPDLSPIEGATVRLMGSKWSIERESISTNSAGFFTFKISKPGIYYLGVDARGFQKYLIKIKVDRRSSWPRIQMDVGT